MRTTIVIALVLCIASSAMASDSIMSVTIGKDGVEAIEFAETKIVAAAYQTSDSFKGFWQRDEGKMGSVFLSPDAATTTQIKAALDIYRVSYTESDVSLPAKERQWLLDSDIRGRSDAEKVLRRARVVDSATTVEDLKNGLLREALIAPSEFRPD